MICHVSRWKNLESWIPGGEEEWEAIHPLAPVEDMLTPRTERVELEDSLGNWQAITIHFDGSVVPRERTTPFKGSMFAAYPGDLVFSKIDVRNGAIGLIPDSMSKVVVTSEYPIHRPDLKTVDSRYLALLLRTPNFLALIRRAASGTSGRKRITPDTFRQIEVPLPEPEEQRRMVDAYDNALRKAAALDTKADALEGDAQEQFEADLGLAPPPGLPKRPFQIARFRDIERWSHEGILQTAVFGGNPQGSKYAFVELGEVATVSYGLQKCPGNRPRKHPRSYLRVANVQRGFLDLAEIKEIDVPDRDMPKYRLQGGDVLLCEGNSAELVGRGAIWHEEIPDCVHQNHVLRVRVDKSRAAPEFVLAYINSASGQAYFRSKAKRTTNLSSINSKEVAELPLPLPDDLHVQCSILDRLESSLAGVRKTRNDARQLRTTAWNDFIAGIFA